MPRASPAAPRAPISPPAISPPPRVRPPLAMSAFNPASAPVTAPPRIAVLPSGTRWWRANWPATRSRISPCAWPSSPCSSISCVVLCRTSASSAAARRCCAAPAGSAAASASSRRATAPPIWRSRWPMPAPSATVSRAAAVRARLAASTCIDSSKTCWRRWRQTAASRAMASARSPCSTACTAVSSVASCTQQRAKASSGSTARTSGQCARWVRQASTSAASCAAARGAPSWLSSTSTGLPTQASRSISGAT